ncbi:MAG: hypothetical protein JF625_02585 [Inquilinus limosus]|uniref:Uncharacterized protein n=1 Tax=Inquilinus limosus TaxID=171674 RepID=A0A952FFN9_9PROT|nr:hypothetical protein [Inquilinus limosus]
MINVCDVCSLMYNDFQKINGICPNCFKKGVEHYSSVARPRLKDLFYNNIIIKKLLLKENTLECLSRFIESGFLDGRRFRNNEMGPCYEREIQKFIVGAVESRFPQVMMEAAVRGTLIEAGAVGPGRPPIRFRENERGRSSEYDIVIYMEFEETSKPAYIIEVKRFGINGYYDLNKIALDFDRCAKSVEENSRRGGSISCAITCFDIIHNSKEKLDEIFSKIRYVAHMAPIERRCNMVNFNDLSPAESRKVVYVENEVKRTVFWRIGIYGFVSRVT